MDGGLSLQLQDADACFCHFRFVLAVQEDVVVQHVVVEPYLVVFARPVCAEFEVVLLGPFVIPKTVVAYVITVEIVW